MSQAPSSHITHPAHESTLIARCIGVWLYCGIAGIALLPAARAHSSAFGWIAYWLVGAPLLMWAMHDRHRLAQRGRAILVGLNALRSTGVAGAGSPFDRRQGRRHVGNHAQARRLHGPMHSGRRQQRIRAGAACAFTVISVFVALLLR